MPDYEKVVGDKRKSGSGFVPARTVDFFHPMPQLVHVNSSAAIRIDSQHHVPGALPRPVEPELLSENHELILFQRSVPILKHTRERLNKDLYKSFPGKVQ